MKVVLSLISVVNKDSSRVNLVLILDNRSLPTCSNLQTNNELVDT